MAKNAGSADAPDENLTPDELTDTLDEPASLDRDAWLEKYEAASSRSNRWFYTGVAVFGGMIALMWIIGLDLQIKALITKRGVEASIVNETKSNWEKIFAERDKKAADLNVKQALNQMRAALSARPPAVSTTTGASAASSTTSDLTTTSTTADNKKIAGPATTTSNTIPATSTKIKQ